MRLGDSIRITDYIETEGGWTLGVDFTIINSKDGERIDENWHTDDLNDNVTFVITGADCSGGNKDDNEHRIYMISSSGEELDHMTVRVDDDQCDDL